MKMAWFCIPAHGHTNPTLGLVKEMTAAGHEIVYFSFEQFREKIESAGAEFIPCDEYDFNTIVYTSKEFQPCADTFSDKYCFIGPSIRPVFSPMEKTAKKTIYISMGTVMKNKEIYKNCVEALRDTDYQVIISLGENVEEYADLPDHIKVYASVDQMAVLSIADVFLTHCGMNSTSEALYYEVPLVLFPQTPEQGAVAKRVEELGAGVKLPSTEKDVIRQTIEEVLGNDNYKSAVKEISKGFKCCGGVKAAREYLEGLYASMEKDI